LITEQDLISFGLRAFVATLWPDFNLILGIDVRRL
jgi:hypothetical protein